MGVRGPPIGEAFPLALSPTPEVLRSNLRSGLPGSKAPGSIFGSGRKSPPWPTACLTSWLSGISWLRRRWSCCSSPPPSPPVYPSDRPPLVRDSTNSGGPDWPGPLDPRPASGGAGFASDGAGAESRGGPGTGAGLPARIRRGQGVAPRRGRVQGSALQIKFGRVAVRQGALFKGHP